MNCWKSYPAKVRCGMDREAAIILIDQLNAIPCTPETFQERYAIVQQLGKAHGIWYTGGEDSFWTNDAGENLGPDPQPGSVRAASLHEKEARP